MAEDHLTRRLAALVSADVVGYSRLMADDEIATVRSLAACREQVSVVVRSSSRSGPFRHPSLTRLSRVLHDRAGVGILRMRAVRRGRRCSQDLPGVRPRERGCPADHGRRQYRAGAHRAGSGGRRNRAAGETGLHPCRLRCRRVLQRSPAPAADAGDARARWSLTRGSGLPHQRAKTPIPHHRKSRPMALGLAIPSAAGITATR